MDATQSGRADALFPIVEKLCTACGALKSASEFSARKELMSGLSSQCKTCRSVANRKHYEANKDRLQAQHRAYWAADPKRAKAIRRKSVIKNREQRKLYARQYRQFRPDITKAAEKRWRDNNPNTRRAHQLRGGARRRAREAAAAAAGIPFTAIQLAQRWAYYGNSCWICREPATQTDHVKPLAKGGSHILANLRPICGACNRKKGAKWPYSGRATHL